MPAKENKVVIRLTRANAALAAEAAALLKTTVEEIVSLCLRGSTNPLKTKRQRQNF